MPRKRRCRSGKRDNRRQPEKPTTAPQNDASLESPRENTDTGILLHHFPAELWKMILETATKENDAPHLTNLTNASLFFRHELHPHRVLFLFRQVLPPLLPYLTPSSIRQCREVCSSWNATILNFLVHHPSLLDISPNSTPLSPPLSSLLAPKVFENYLDIHLFLARLQPSHYDPSKIPAAVNSLFSRDTAEGLTANPFPNRAVTLSLFGSADNNEHQNRFAFSVLATSQLLKLFGHHVYFGTVHSPREQGPGSKSSTFYLCLVEWLRHMGNLKVLKTQFHGEDDGTVAEKMEEMLDNEYRIPTLENLEVLEIYNLPEIIVTELLRANGHVKKLKISGILGNGRIFEKQLPNLTALSLGLRTAQDFLKGEESQNGGWNLEELYLQVEEKGSVEGESDLDQWSRIGAVMENKWGGTLRQVRVDLPKGLEEGEVGRLLEEQRRKLTIKKI